MEEHATPDDTLDAPTDTPNAAIEVDSLSKQYRVSTALSEVTFSVAPGEVCGLLGPNGAGKTTLLRILATVLRPSQGRVEIAGGRVPDDNFEIRRRIGYMPDRFAGYEELRIDAFLEFFAHLYELPRENIEDTVRDILELVDLRTLRHAPISSISLGVRQRLSLARVLLHNPSVLLLDEPVSGLDPRARVEMRELLRELGSMGKTVLISSHVLGDLDELCDRYVILERGAVVFSGSSEELQSRVRGATRVLVAVARKPEDARTAIRRKPWVTDVRDAAIENGFEVELAEDTPLETLSEFVRDEGFSITHFAKHEVDLEEAFLSVTRGAVT